MSQSYEEYNETRFEAYCKTCIENAVLKERMRKASRAKWELSFSELKESFLREMASECIHPCEENEVDTVFVVRDAVFHVHDERIARMLPYLLPKDREIILLYYFGNMNDYAVANTLNLTRATVERRRRKAQEMMRRMLEGGV